MSERLERWRLVLGQAADQELSVPLSAELVGMDRMLEALYDSQRTGGLGASSPNVARWLGDQVEPDVHLIASLVSLRRVNPARTKETARQGVRKVVEELEKRHRSPMHQAVRGALLCVDQSGSMATLVVYSSIFGAVLASLRSVSTSFVLFDTAVVDMTDQLRDPVDLLFGTQLGGGTDINRALAYCQQIISRPAQTILVLITDLYEGGDAQQMLARAAALKQSGVNVVCLLALSDHGAPSYDHAHAHAFAALGIPAFACTPDLFPDLMAATIQRQDLGMWAARNEIVAPR